jgi:Ser/Thr protein kinase RdoA (MazF antagonist)
MGRLEHSQRWSTIIRDLAPGRSSRIVSADEYSATCLLLTPDGDRTVLKLALGDQRRLDDLATAWDALTLLSESDGSPAPQPLRRHVIDGTGLAIELSYVCGDHPDFESEEDFFAFGATIGRLHKITRGKTLKSGRAWDVERISVYYSDPALLRLFSEREKAVALHSLESVAPVYNRFLEDGVWTGIIHSDAHRDNILVHEGVGSFIDFAECGQGVLFWDLGVAVADTALDEPDVAERRCGDLIRGYFSILPETEPIISANLDVFTAMRCLEVMTWPVSDWSPERAQEDEDEARENISVCVEYLSNLPNLGTT